MRVLPAPDAGSTRTLKRKGPAFGRALFIVTERTVIWLACNASSNVMQAHFLFQTSSETPPETILVSLISDDNRITN
jgi:hypothetical protein